HQLPYDPSQYLYPWVDVHPQGDLESIYDKQKADPQEAILADLAAKNQNPVADEPAYRPESGGQDNCEHVVPQSWFNKKLPMRGDLHHLFACDVQSNSKRGNSRYADLTGGQRTPEGVLDASDNEFDPDAGRGAVARATLYFLLRYPGEVGDRSSEYSAKDVATLLKWNHDYPPTEYEHHRNEEIFKMQGNRNPLIDFPDLANKIDFTEGLAAQARKAA
ncbi:MAG TPA: endonuclease, partial [Candidatus Xenobia bacterium]